MSTTRIGPVTTAERIGALDVLFGAGRTGHFRADKHPELFRVVVEAGGDELIEARRRFAASHEPPVVRQGLEVATDRGLWELEDSAKLSDRKFVPVKK